MGSILHVSSDGPGNKGLTELNRHMEDDRKEVRDDSMGLSEEDESRINEAVENMNSVTGGAATSLAHHTSLQKHQHPIVRWERFLPVRRLKVLLVENDDSTRQVVSALLRNCSYEVAAAANGLQAWKILEDLTNHIDLVCTEVVMPCFSGIGLLHKIMNHKACKNIPVIMMSSNDSMGTVFKCLSKGAVDFLVKPIRKNELKNLWQHVWRRCHSSSSSGSGIQIQQSTKSKSTDDSDNNTGSNDEDVSGSIGLSARDGSDNGSGTQNSWTKRAVEVNSPQLQFPSDQLADPHDNTSVHAIHPKIETFCNEWVPMTANGEIREQEEAADDIMGKNLETGPHLTEVSTKGTSESVDKSPETHTRDEGLLRLEISNAADKPSMEAADLIGVIANGMVAQPITRDTESPNECSKPSEGKDQAIDSSMDLPSLNLSLKRPRSTREDGTAMHSDCTVLRHSNLSAFSRYHTSAAATQALACYGGSCSPLNNSSEAVKTESAINVVSNGSIDNNDMGSTTKNAFSKLAAFKGKTVAASQVERAHLSAFHPVPLRSSAIPQVMQERRATDAIGEQLMGIQHQVQVQHSHHYYHHHHLHVHSMQQLPDHDELSLTTMAADATRCRSNSGSNQGSYVQNGSSAAVNAGGINVESSNGVTGRSGTEGGNGSGSGSGSGVDQNRFAQREAALNKFRQKRKERNFEKTVRYQSRKRLAEQRPRVRGQFVRRGIYTETRAGKQTASIGGFDCLGTHV